MINIDLFQHLTDIREEKFIFYELCLHTADCEMSVFQELVLHGLDEGDIFFQEFLQTCCHCLSIHTWLSVSECSVVEKLIDFSLEELIEAGIMVPDINYIIEKCHLLFFE